MARIHTFHHDCQHFGLSEIADIQPHFLLLVDYTRGKPELKRRLHTTPNIVSSSHTPGLGATNGRCVEVRQTRLAGELAMLTRMRNET